MNLPVSNKTEIKELTRPIIGIENRSAQEVFDIMCDRIKYASPQPVQDMHELPEVDGARWLLIKRGLYWRPNSQGYTGIKAEAGRYTDAEVKPYQNEPDYYVTAILASEAPDLSPSCTDEAARRHLQSVVSSLTQKLDRAMEALKPFADEAFMYDPDEGDDAATAWNSKFHISAFRRARAALSEPGDKE